MLYQKNRDFSGFSVYQNCKIIGKSEVIFCGTIVMNTASSCGKAFIFTSLSALKTNIVADRMPILEM